MRFETRAVMLVIGAIAVVVALVVGAAKFGSSNSPKVQGINTTGPNLPKRHHKPTRPMARIVLTATNGDSWLLVRAGSAAGKQLYAGTLPQGHQLPFTRRPYAFRRIWFAASKPQNLVAKLNGKIVVIPAAAKGRPEQLLVTPKSIVKAPPVT